MQMQMQFDTPALVMLLKNLYAGHIRYDIANSKKTGRSQSVGKAWAKRDATWKAPAAINSFDCSGFVQYVIHESTRQYHKIPAGSWNQREWLIAEDFASCKAQGESIKAAYKREAPKQDDTVRIAFRDKDPGVPATDTTPEVKERVGHVWLVINGMTYESTSKGGRKIGPKSFHWSTRTKDVDHLFLLGRAPKFQAYKMGYTFRP